MELTQYYPAATLGLRQWVIQTDDEWRTAYLKSFVFFGSKIPGTNKSVGRVRWPLDDTPLVAECRFNKCDSPPGLDHGCGIYAFSNVARLRTLDIGTDLRKPKNTFLNGGNSLPLVAGLMAGWGTRDLFDRGFKCEKAMILALFDHEETYASTRPNGNLYGAESSNTPPRLSMSTGLKETRSYKPHPAVYQAFLRMCEEYDIPILSMNDFYTESALREYAETRGLGLLEDFL